MITIILIKTAKTKKSVTGADFEKTTFMSKSLIRTGHLKERGEKRTPKEHLI